MNREIKFRAWDGETMWDVREIEWAGGEILTLYLGVHSQGMNPDVKLMQFTGLKDKNGKEIYEGDIVRYPLGIGNNLGEVVWRGEEYAGFSIRMTHENGQPVWYYVARWETEPPEVIGNIYENSRLLKP